MFLRALRWVASTAASGSTCSRDSPHSFGAGARPGSRVSGGAPPTEHRPRSSADRSASRTRRKAAAIARATPRTPADDPAPVIPDEVQKLPQLLGEVDPLRALDDGLVPGHSLQAHGRRSLKTYEVDHLEEEVFDEGLTGNVPAFSWLTFGPGSPGNGISPDVGVERQPGDGVVRGKVGDVESGHHAPMMPIRSRSGPGPRACRRPPQDGGSSRRRFPATERQLAGTRRVPPREAPPVPTSRRLPRVLASKVSGRWLAPGKPPGPRHAP